jgi:hypothetical protein
MTLRLAVYRRQQLGAGVVRGVDDVLGPGADLRERCPGQPEQHAGPGGLPRGVAERGVSVGAPLQIERDRGPGELNVLGVPEEERPQELEPGQDCRG